ncbi:IS66 family transposase [Lactobacillus sp. ESL0791]|nr:IS66 family transposase [Lactobacillus sp. ESL0791]
MQNWQRLGWQTSNATLANWVINGVKLVKPVCDAIHKHLLAQQYLQGDETTVQVLREAKRPAQSKSYAWVMRTVERAKQAAVYYAYSPTRASSFAQELYQGFTGVLQCDGYAGYNQVASKARIGCWAHTRRKFFDALKTDEQAQAPFDIIQKMFAKERMWQDLPAADRLVMRQKK